MVGRNAEGRIRFLSMVARLQLGEDAGALAHLDRVLDQCEACCTVTQSVGPGIPIDVEVKDVTGRLLKPASA